MLPWGFYCNSIFISKQLNKIAEIKGSKNRQERGTNFPHSKIFFLVIKCATFLFLSSALVGFFFANSADPESISPGHLTLFSFPHSISDRMKWKQLSGHRSISIGCGENKFQGIQICRSCSGNFNCVWHGTFLVSDKKYPFLAAFFLLFSLPFPRPFCPFCGFSISQQETLLDPSTFFHCRRHECVKVPK